MTENVENLILEQIKAMRGDVTEYRNEVGSMRKNTDALIIEMRGRLQSIERYIAVMHADITNIAERLDNSDAKVDARLERLEQRLAIS